MNEHLTDAREHNPDRAHAMALAGDAERTHAADLRAQAETAAVTVTPESGVHYGRVVSRELESKSPAIAHRGAERVAANTMASIAQVNLGTKGVEAVVQGYNVAAGYADNAASIDEEIAGAKYDAKEKRRSAGNVQTGDR